MYVCAYCVMYDIHCITHGIFLIILYQNLQLMVIIVHHLFINLKHVHK